MNLIWHWMGLTNGSGKLYLFWSGIFADVTIFGVGVTALRHLNCHAKGCPRLGKHLVEGTPYKVCAKHHPTAVVKPTHGDILEAHVRRN